MTMKTYFSPKIAVAFGIAVASSSVQALTITQTDSTSPLTMLNALLAPGSGINVIGGSLTYVGKTTPGKEQGATYSGFNLSPLSGPGATIINPDGILLTTGTSQIPFTNTVPDFSNGNTYPSPGTGPSGPLSAISGLTTADKNFISFNFTLDPSKTSVNAKFVFASDEYPTQTVTDIFGFFVDGVNYAYFPGGALVSNVPAANFQNNPLGSSGYQIEFNGLTTSLSVEGLINTSLTTHTLMIAIADTNDAAYESAVFIGGLTAANGVTGGIVDSEVPVPASAWLMASGLLGLLGARRRQAK
jgi:hypothetical protein